ncbi:MAG TPA: hypothetical protein PLW34_11900, partial [Termitinemataceae bacterium]|nr:hypothetical protein [Termitinemataceae bacterium]
IPRDIYTRDIYTYITVFLKTQQNFAKFLQYNTIDIRDNRYIGDFPGKKWQNFGTVREPLTAGCNVYWIEGAAALLASQGAQGPCDTAPPIPGVF